MIRHRDPEDNRIKTVTVHEEHVLNCFVINSTSPGDCLAKLSLKGVPPGTMIIGSYYDTQWQSHIILLYNSRWPIVERGERPEMLKLETEVIQVKADQPRRSLQTQPLTMELGTVRIGSSKELENGLHLRSSGSDNLAKFTNPALGEPHSASHNPFDKDWKEETWRERGSQL